MNFDVADISLKNSIGCITVKDNEQMIGMGRIVGDGSIYFYIQDIVVHPDYQKHGIGKEIMHRLVTYLHENALIRPLSVCLHQKVKNRSMRNLILKTTHQT